MYKPKNLLLLLAVFIFTAGSLFAQSSASSAADVSIQLKKGLSITNTTGPLDFGEVVLTGVAQTETINPSAGVKFEVLGHPGKNVTVSFADATLSDGGTNTLTFQPDVEHTFSSSTYGTGNIVSSGNSVILTNDAGIGRLYLWLGGSIDVAGAVETDYTGSFSVTVAY